MVEQELGRSGPIDASERSTLLDSLRGWALLGILIANMVAFIGFSFLDDAGREATLGGSLDDLAELLIEWLIVGKFYSIFSLLFGIGFAIQLGRLEQRGEGVPRYLRRLAVLFLIGMAHLLLLWIGDIVALYALMGGVLLLFRRQSDRNLIRWAVLLWLVPLAWSALIHFGGIDLADPIYGLGLKALTAAGIDVNMGPLAYYRDTGFVAALAIRPGEALLRLGDLVYQMRFTKVLGMFLIGLWVGRHAIFANLDAHVPLLRKVAVWGCSIGLPVSLAKAILSMWPGESRPAIEFAAEAGLCFRHADAGTGLCGGVCTDVARRPPRSVGMGGPRWPHGTHQLSDADHITGPAVLRLGPRADRQARADIRIPGFGSAICAAGRLQPLVARAFPVRPGRVGVAQPYLRPRPAHAACRRLGDRCLDDLARLARRFADRQRVDIFHAALDLAPDGILIVEEAGVVEADEELAVGAVRIAACAPSSRCRGRAARSLNSALRSGSSLPPVPVPVGSPPWAMKPGITRWNTTPS